MPAAAANRFPWVSAGKQNINKQMMWLWERLKDLYDAVLLLVGVYEVISAAVLQWTTICWKKSQHNLFMMKEKVWECRARSGNSSSESNRTYLWTPWTYVIILQGDFEKIINGFVQPDTARQAVPQIVFSLV